MSTVDLPVQPGAPTDEPAPLGTALHAALEAVDDTVFRTGAAVDDDAFARIVEKRDLSAEDAALLRVHARRQGLLEEEPRGDDWVDRAAAAGRAGSGALQSEFTSLRTFFESARRYPLLTAAQEKSLARRYEQGMAARTALSSGKALAPEQRDELVHRAADGQHAKDRFVCCNLRLVASIARHFRFQGLDLPDVLQEGILGLIRAVEKFDHRLGYKFSTYATWWIRQAICRAIADKGRVIRLPVHIHELVRKIVATERRLCWELEREPTVSDIADHLGIDAGHVAFVKDAARGVASLDAAIGTGDGDSTLIDFVAGTELSVEEQVFEDDRRDRLEQALAQIPHREADVLRQRFGLGAIHPRTLEVLGRQYGVTRERIRQLETQGLKKLQAILECENLLSIDDPPKSAARPGRNPVRETDESRLARLSVLSDQERDVMIRRFGIGRDSMSAQAVAEDMGQVPAWVLERQAAALAKLKGNG